VFDETVQETSGPNSPSTMIQSSKEVEKTKGKELQDVEMTMVSSLEVEFTKELKMGDYLFKKVIKNDHADFLTLFVSLAIKTKLSSLFKFRLWPNSECWDFCDVDFMIHIEINL
jgi:hypothetical protein